MPTVSVPIPWSELEKKSPYQQKLYLAKFKFKREPALRNVKKGDILVCKGSIGSAYEHYFLCVDVKYPEVKIIEYTGVGPSENPCGYLRAGSADLTGLGRVQFKTYTYAELGKKGVEKEIWPKELERYDDDEVINRAKRREGESWYDMLTNNCEHFVRWCKCGLKVSLQVKGSYTWIRECVYSLVSGCKKGITEKISESSIEKLTILIANASDEVAGLLSKKYGAIVVGVAFALVLETGKAIYEIKKAIDQRDKGILIERDELLKAKIVGIIVKAVCRLCLGTLGSGICLAGGPIRSLLGGAIGGAAGHFLGFCIGWCYENIQYIDG